MKYIDVRFNSQGIGYTYKAADHSIVAGDKVVVHNQGNNSTSIVTVVKVHEEFEEDPRVSYTWIVQKIDFTEYGRLVDKDRQALDLSRETKRGRL